ncbi:MAG: putative inner membrane protein [Syntrophorhabdaceae bacterium PtaU1.Bin034]|nr:MAG: putative inner membrane protein [Syntrophorhabdaceae bacterium PtaU1.Bin034]
MRERTISSTSKSGGEEANTQKTERFSCFTASSPPRIQTFRGTLRIIAFTSAIGHSNSTVDLFKGIGYVVGGHSGYYISLCPLFILPMPSANEKKFYFFTMLALVLILGYLSYLILRPFLTPVGWAVVFSIVFFPVYKFILKYVKWNSLAAAITVITVCLLIIGPFSYFAYLLTSEISNVSIEIVDVKGATALLNHPAIAPIVKRILSFFDMSQIQLQASIVKSLSAAGKKLLEYLPARIGDAAGAAVHFALMSFALFFFLRDGAQFLGRTSEYMPFSTKHKDRLVRQVKDIVISTIYGGLVVAVCQGFIGATAFALLGVHSPILWGLAISISSFIPVVGSSIVWVPAVLLFLIKGFIAKAVILTLVGVLGISMVDNVLRPIIMRGRLRMPLLVIFLSVLGGIEVFGLLGLVMGPLVLAVFISVVDIFRDVEGAYE